MEAPERGTILRLVSETERSRAHFTLAGFPVRIHPFFWVVTVMFGLPQGSGWSQEVLARIALWVAIIFVSILWHELGHAFVMRRYGYSPWIELYGFGGRTGWGGGPAAPSPKTRVLVSLAGPFAGFLLGGIVYGVGWGVGSGRHWALDELFTLMLWVNVGWGACNLVPMLPWDGGHALHGVLDHVTGGKGLRPTAYVTIASAASIAGLTLWLAPGWWWPLVLCGLSVAIAVRAIRGPPKEAPAPKAAFDPMMAIASAREALERAGDPAALVSAALQGTKREGWSELATNLCESVAEHVASPSQRALAYELASWAYLLGGEAEDAARAARKMRPTHDPSPILEAAIAVRCGDFEGALGASRELDDHPGARRLIHAYSLAALGRVDEALEALEGDREAGASADAALFYAERFDAAAALGASLFERFGEAEDAYNAACSHSRAGRADEGLSWLERAVDAGFDDLAQLESDDDLAAVRGLTGYAPIRDRVGSS